MTGWPGLPAFGAIVRADSTQYVVPNLLICSYWAGHVLIYYAVYLFPRWIQAMPPVDLCELALLQCSEIESHGRCPRLHNVVAVARCNVDPVNTITERYQVLCALSISYDLST